MRVSKLTCAIDAFEQGYSMDEDANLMSATIPGGSTTYGEASAPELSAFLNALGDGVYAIDRQGRCTFVNRAALAMLDYGTETDLLGRNMHETVHHTRPDGSHYPADACPLLGTLKSGKPVRLENELLWRRDGTSFFAEYSSFPVLDGGSPHASLITFSDLSLRQDRSRRHALQRAVSEILEGADEVEAIQARLVAAIGSGFGWDAGTLWLREGVGEEKVTRAAAWYSTNRNHRLADALPGSGFLRGRELALKALQESKVVTSETTHGKAGDADLTPRFSIAFPLRATGKVVGAFAFASHRSLVVNDEFADELSTLGQQAGQFVARRRPEAALRDSEALTTAIMETALDCVVVIDAETHVREFNPAAEQTFGWTRESAIGTELDALILPADFLVGHLRKFAAFLEAGEVGAINKRVEAEAIGAEGRRFPVEISVTPSRSGISRCSRHTFATLPSASRPKVRSRRPGMPPRPRTRPRAPSSRT